MFYICEASVFKHYDQCWAQLYSPSNVIFKLQLCPLTNPSSKVLNWDERMYDYQEDRFDNIDIASYLRKC
jgi:hypothetical protein